VKSVIILKRCLHTTGKRLGAVAGDANGLAGYKRPNSHETFCGVTPAIVPNRLLAAADFAAHHS